MTRFVISLCRHFLRFTIALAEWLANAVGACYDNIYKKLIDCKGGVGCEDIDQGALRAAHDG